MLDLTSITSITLPTHTAGRVLTEIREGKTACPYLAARTPATNRLMDLDSQQSPQNCSGGQ